MSLPLVDEILNIDTTATDLVETPTETTVPAVVEAETVTAMTVAPVMDNRLENDVEFAREKMRDLIGKGREAIDSASLLAQSGDSPRAYEVVGSMLTSVIQANKELMNIHKIRQDTVEQSQVGSPSVDGSGTTINVDRAVFVGKASDLLREIRQIASIQQ